MIKDYFASMNTSNGFCSYFNEIFNPEKLEAIYIIKGGSGTGKSTIMKRIANHFEEMGYETERFYCSSDSNSLDGIIIDGRASVIDGTAPHTTDPKYPGAVEEIINLSCCWDIDKIKQSKNEIIRLSGEKSNCYRKGYSFLSAAGKIKREIQSIVGMDFNEEKMYGAILRYLKQNNFKGSGKNKTVRLVSGISASGITHLNSFENSAERICLLTNSHGCEGVFFNAFSRVFDEAGIESIVSFDAICPENINAIYYPEIKLCVTASNGSEDLYDTRYKVFNLERFIDKNVLMNNRSKLRFANKCLNSLIDGASDAFADAKAYHEEIERIYVKCVDFEQVRLITDKLIDCIQAIITR